jgi:Sulfatase
MITADDIGWFNVSLYNLGIMGYRTPNIDRLGKEGAMFTDWYGEQSCTAGRAAFITGQSPICTGLTKVGLPGATIGLPAEDMSVAEALKPLGYATGQFGKNHLGDRNEYLPRREGDQPGGRLSRADGDALARHDPARHRLQRDVLALRSNPDLRRRRGRSRHRGQMPEGLADWRQDLQGPPRRFQSHGLFSRSEGLGSATCLNTRGLQRCMMRLMTPPLPAVARPSKTITRAPSATVPSLQPGELDLKLCELFLKLLTRHLPWAGSAICRYRRVRALLLAFGQPFHSGCRCTAAGGSLYSAVGAIDP